MEKRKIKVVLARDVYLERVQFTEFKEVEIEIEDDSKVNNCTTPWVVVGQTQDKS